MTIASAAVAVVRDRNTGDFDSNIWGTFRPFDAPTYTPSRKPLSAPDVCWSAEGSVRHDRCSGRRGRSRSRRAMLNSGVGKANRLRVCTRVPDCRGPNKPKKFQIKLLLSFSNSICFISYFFPNKHSKIKLTQLLGRWYCILKNIVELKFSLEVIIENEPNTILISFLLNINKQLAFLTMRRE